VTQKRPGPVGHQPRPLAHFCSPIRAPRCATRTHCTISAAMPARLRSAHPRRHIVHRRAPERIIREARRPPVHCHLLGVHAIGRLTPSVFVSGPAPPRRWVRPAPRRSRRAASVRAFLAPELILLGTRWSRSTAAISFRRWCADLLRASRGINRKGGAPPSERPVRLSALTTKQCTGCKATGRGRTHRRPHCLGSRTARKRLHSTGEGSAAARDYHGDRDWIARRGCSTCGEWEGAATGFYPRRDRPSQYDPAAALVKRNGIRVQTI
jgi:hypothetical protein